MRGSESNSQGLTRREWLRTVGVAGVAGAAGATGCVGGDGSSGLPERNEYVSAESADAETLVHHQIADAVSGGYVRLTLDGAYGVTTDVEVFPLWMDINQADDEGRVYEAELREGLEWSDPYGSMTAEDWVYHIQNIHKGEENWAGSQKATSWQGIQVEETGERTFEITLSAPNTDFPFEPVLWAANCYPKDLVEPYIEEQDLEGLQQDEELNELSYTGNLGPYKYERWDRGAEYVVTPNEDYYIKDADDVPEAWLEAPHFDSYSSRVVEEESSRLEALRNREVTTTGIPKDRVEEFRGVEGIEVYEIPQPFLAYMPYNQRRNGWEGLKNQEVRQALSSAVDKAEIVNDVLRGFGNVAHTHQPEWSKWFSDDSVVRFGEGETYDPEGARETLADALPEYGYNDSDEFVDGEGEQVTLDFIYRTGSENTETISELIEQAYEGLGFAVERNALSFDRIGNQVQQNEYVGEGESPWNSGPYNAGPPDETESEMEWDLALGSAINTYPRTPASLEAFWTERGSFNFYGYLPDEDMAAKFDEMRRSGDERTAELVAEVLGIISEDQPVNFLFMTDSTPGFMEELEGPREEFGHGWNALQTWQYV